MKKVVLFCFTIFFSVSLFSQEMVKGTVKDANNEPIFAADVFWKNEPTKGTTTDFDGNFELNVLQNSDTLVVSFLGYQTKYIPVNTEAIPENINVVLSEDVETLQEIEIQAKQPISKKFSVLKLKKSDIYLSPNADNDPLKAITNLPYSTNTEESANPTLRGSDPDRSRIVLNGVPVYRPVRNSQLNGIGNFSLFNSEIIHDQYVYASNPPLTYGNTTAGLVSIQTQDELEKNTVQIAAGLASVGGFISQRLSKETFFQIYGNYQFPDAYLDVNKKSTEQIKSFHTKDIGLNFHAKIAKDVKFNSFTYVIDEDFDVDDFQFGYSGSSTASKKRLFTVNNFSFFNDKGVTSVNSGYNTSNSDYQYGNIDSKLDIKQFFLSINYRTIGLDNFSLKTGIDYDYSLNKFYGDVPVYYYAIAPDSPSENINNKITNAIIEPYLYLNIDLSKTFSFGSGIRTNFKTQSQKQYVSYQGSLKTSLNSKNSILLSGGHYNSYQTPDYYNQHFNLLKSDQYAVDYTFDGKMTYLNLGFYYKDESGDVTTPDDFVISETKTFGIELYFKQDIGKYFNFSISNTFLDQKVTIGDKEYKSSDDLDYFVKTSIQYTHPKVFNLSLNYVTRPGNYYTNVDRAEFDRSANAFKPIYQNDINGSQFDSYNNLSLNINRYFAFKGNGLILYGVVNNILDTDNQFRAAYTADYSQRFFTSYQKRSFYFGAVLQLNH
ncbi:TonB-dependent receptor plug domain-containing protein [Aureivirga sp. CE67]|uniref:TonB-dependent receptor plug domain-containing protein n=1 Tax=Aureivirga sp. CE67 TaxID=1788983 RepID=UPI0018CAD4F6|nr:carboxypeptidase-like regulatory domain-containing protein [Aureivirga sp. CE67]